MKTLLMNRILMYLNSSEYIKGWLNTICKEKQHREDLFQFCLIQITNENIDKLNDLLYKNDLDKYFITVIKNQYKSDKSYFYKQYVNNGFYKKDFMVLKDDLSRFETCLLYTSDAADE